MKAYIDIEASRGIGFIATVVTEQDHHRGGPFAYSYQSPICEDSETAERKAFQWAEKNGWTVTSADEVDVIRS
jgi:hypothetical protein